MAASKIVDLRNLLAERFPHPPLPCVSRFSTGVPAFDEATNGGLPKGAITELTTGNVSAGSASFICALLQQIYRAANFLALIDGRDSFDPEPLGNPRLRHLLWVRCTAASDALKAADLLLRDQNFPVVVLDLVLNEPVELRKIPQTNWYRLQRLVEPTATAFLVLGRHRMVSSAQLKLTLENSWTLENLQQDHSLSRVRFGLRGEYSGQIIEAVS